MKAEIHSWTQWMPRSVDCDESGPSENILSIAPKSVSQEAEQKWSWKDSKALQYQKSSVWLILQAAQIRPEQ